MKAAWKNGGLLLLCGAACVLTASRSAAQLSGTFTNWRDHPAIEYRTQPTTDPVAALNREIDSGRALSFEGPSGYLQATLDALRVPVTSQVAVFVQDSAQRDRISPTNPRTIFFNDTVAVGWVRGGFIELAAHDARQGAIFYTLDVIDVAKPRFRRRDDCLSCHYSYSTVGVPGMLDRSAGQFAVNHTLPVDRRWGGWFVTSRTAFRHLGNESVDRLPAVAPVSPPSASFEHRFDTTGYLSTQSDVVALLVFDHQMHGLNLLTRIGWEARVAGYRQQSSRTGEPDVTGEAPTSMADAAREVVDYLLFIDEAPLPGRLEGASGFAEQFTARGPRDRRGRSLREFDLVTRLMRYPCSYLIYSDALDALPVVARDAIYARLADVLTGREHAARYQRLAREDRQAILEILRDTKDDFAAFLARDRAVARDARGTSPSAARAVPPPGRGRR